MINFLRTNIALDPKYLLRALSLKTESVYVMQRLTAIFNVLRTSVRRRKINLKIAIEVHLYLTYFIADVYQNTIAANAVIQGDDAMI